jgi:hypothetical protein
MVSKREGLGLDQPAVYQIKVQGELDEDWSDWLDDLLIHVDQGMTTLTGAIADQPALHGLLVKIRDLGLPLISVEYMADGTPDAPEGNGSSPA